MGGHLCDLSLPPEALKTAARWIAWRSELPGTAVTLGVVGDQVFAEVRGRRTDLMINSGYPPGTPEKTIGLTRGALWAAAQWCMGPPDAADVDLLVDDRMLLVYQGDEWAGFDTDGSPASEEYLAVAPLDR